MTQKELVLQRYRQLLAEMESIIADVEHVGQVRPHLAPAMAPDDNPKLLQVLQDMDKLRKTLAILEADAT